MCAHYWNFVGNCSHQEAAAGSRVVTLPEPACSGSCFSLVKSSDQSGCSSRVTALVHSGCLQNAGFEALCTSSFQKQISQKHDGIAVAVTCSLNSDLVA